MSDVVRVAPQPAHAGPGHRPRDQATHQAPHPISGRAQGMNALAPHTSLAREQLAQVQSQAGNGAALSLMQAGAHSDLALQRQPPVAAPAPGVTPPSPAGPAPARLPDFGNTHFVHIGPRFDLNYRPVGPLPQLGKVTVTLKIHVIFKNFSRAMLRSPDFAGHRWTRAQLRDFNWPDAEKATWAAKFGAAVKAGWAAKHAFVLNQPDFAPHKATFDVDVTHVDDPAQANNVITAQWVPRDAPRLRSFVSGDTSTLDVRDVDQPETYTVEEAQVIRQIPGFDNNSAAINSEVETGIASFEADFRRKQQTKGPLDVPMDQIQVIATGRSTTPGSRRRNRDLGAERAQNVADRLMDDLSLAQTRSNSVGETNATDEPQFRRVDVRAIVGDEREVTQNTAAHEAGHMFGLGDEYVEEAPTDPDVAAKFAGDQPSHYQDVKDTMGEAAANDLLNQEGPSMMSSGSDVKAGHYVYFLRALNSVTGKSWTVE